MTLTDLNHFTNSGNAFPYLSFFVTKLEYNICSTLAYDDNYSNSQTRG
jgi:hypothetical protein